MGAVMRAGGFSCVAAAAGDGVGGGKVSVAELEDSLRAARRSARTRRKRERRKVARAASAAEKIEEVAQAGAAPVLRAACAAAEPPLPLPPPPRGCKRPIVSPTGAAPMEVAGEADQRMRFEDKLRELEGQEAQVKAAGKLDPELASVIAEAKKVLQDALDNL